MLGVAILSAVSINIGCRLISIGLNMITREFSQILDEKSLRDIEDQIDIEKSVRHYLRKKSP
jgi:hypothetical protein